MSESRRYGTMFGREGQPLILDTATKQKLALGSACTRLNEQQAEIDRLNGLVEALMPRTNEELEAELDAAEAVPVSEEMIRGMVKFATDGDYRAISEQNFNLRREVDRLKAELDQRQVNLEACHRACKAFREVAQTMKAKREQADAYGWAMSGAVSAMLAEKKGRPLTLTEWDKAETAILNRHRSEAEKGDDDED